MWNNIARQLGQYPNAVLTGIDASGYPFSLRCQPRVDEMRQVLLISPHGDEHIQPGPAGLLCHYHNEEMWDLKSFQLLGRLERTEQGWVFHVERAIPESAPGPLAPFQMIAKSGGDAKKYLKKHGLPRPTVDWKGIKALRAEAKKSG